MAAVSHARFHPPAPPTAVAPPTAMWEASDDKSKNLSPAFMRPLYASCRDRQQMQHRQQFRWQNQKKQPGPPSRSCDHHHNRHHSHHHHHHNHSHHQQPRPTTTTTNNQTSPPPPSLNNFLVLNELPRMPSTVNSPSAPKPSPESAPTSSPFMRLPVEIRLQIYSHLLLPSKPSDLTPNYERVASSMQDSFDYTSSSTSTFSPVSSKPVLRIRTIDPERYHERLPSAASPSFRTTYSVRASRFRSRCMLTTYRCINPPRFERDLGIMRTCRRIHAETVGILYGSYTFDFDTHVEAVAPFLSDLTPLARSCVRSVRLVKRALAYEREAERGEWSSALRYLTSDSAGVSLRRLELGVVAGKPGEKGWERIAAYSAADFGRLGGCMEGMEWMQYLLEVGGLRELDVSAVVEHCPPVTSSSAMANYVRFSASVEAGFAEFLKGKLLG